MMRKRNSDPIFPIDGTNEKRERKSLYEVESQREEAEMDARTGNGRVGDDEEMINVVDVSDSEERMDTSDHRQPAKEDIQNTPGPSIVVEPCISMSTSLTAASASSSLPLDLSKKKRRLTASTSLTEDDHKEDDGDYSDSEQRQRKGIAGFSGTRGGSFGAGTSSSSSSSAIKWRRQPLECDIPSRGESPSVIVGGTADVNHVAGIQQQHPIVGRHASDAWQIQQQQRPSVIRSADFTFEPPESTDVDEHFRKSLGGEQPTAEAAVDDHFARALGDVWWALKNRMHLTSTGEDGSASRSSPSPASLSSLATTSNCVVVSSFNSSLSTTSSNSQSTVSSQASANDTTAKANASTTFPSSTPLKKRILSKAAVEAAAQRLEINNAESAPSSNNNVEGDRDGHSDRMNNNTNSNSTISDEDSRKSLSAPNTPPPTPL